MSDQHGAHDPREENRGFYECANCHESVGIRESNYKRLSWAARRFGFVNIDRFLNRVQDCCDWPDYTSVGGFEREVPQEGPSDA